jgi:hypothetical protein
MLQFYFLPVFYDQRSKHGKSVDALRNQPWFLQPRIRCIAYLDLTRLPPSQLFKRGNRFPAVTHGYSVSHQISTHPNASLHIARKISYVYQDVSSVRYRF